MNTMSYNFVPSKKMILNAAIDAVRKESVAAFGLTARPDRTIRQAKKFSLLREQQWQEELAVEMVWFARSQDVVDGWPYERFIDRLETKGISLPAGLTIAAAVEEVDRSLARLDPKFHANNIDIPMSRRASSVLVGTPSLLTGQDETESGSWVRARANDQQEQALIELHQTSVRAARLLRQRAKQVWLASGSLPAGGNQQKSQLRSQRENRLRSRPARESQLGNLRGSQQTLATCEYEAAVFDAAATVFERISQAPNYDEFDVIVRLCEPVAHDPEMPDLPLATLIANQRKPHWKHTKGWDQFARDIGWEVKAAIATLDAKDSKKQKS